MAKRFPLRPNHPERICWGCDKYCPATSMRCGNGSDRTQHPMETFGENWADDELAAAETTQQNPIEADDGATA